MNFVPILSGKEADDFFERVAEGLKHKADFTPTPGLEEARNLLTFIRNLDSLDEKAKQSKIIFKTKSVRGVKPQ